VNNIRSATFYQDGEINSMFYQAGQTIEGIQYNIEGSQYNQVGTAVIREKEQLRKRLTELAADVQRAGPSTAGLVGEIQGAEQDLDRGDGVGVQDRLRRVREALVKAGAAQTLLQAVGAALELAAGMTG
jgi:hypothetical protein